MAGFLFEQNYAFERYFFVSILLASGVDAGTEGVELVLDDEPPVAPVPPVVLDDELAPPGAVVSVDEVALLEDEGVVGAVVDGAGAGAVGAGAGGAMVLVSSFLQAVRPTATMAASRIERFIVFLF